MLKLEPLPKSISRSQPLLDEVRFTHANSVIPAAPPSGRSMAALTKLLPPNCVAVVLCCVHAPEYGGYPGSGGDDGGSIGGEGGEGGEGDAGGGKFGESIGTVNVTVLEYACEVEIVNGPIS